MQITNDLEVGQVVRSKAGRDKGEVFVILEIIDDKYVLLADGKLRRLDKPKKKKVTHLIVYKTIIKDLREKIVNGEKFNNSYIRRILEPFNKEI